MKNQHRVNVRIPGCIYNHIQEICGEDGLYENASEFFRDLARRHYEQSENEKLLRLNATLAPLLNRPIEEFTPFDAEKDLEEIERQYLAEKMV